MRAYKDWKALFMDVEEGGDVVQYILDNTSDPRAEKFAFSYYRKKVEEWVAKRS